MRAVGAERGLPRAPPHLKTNQELAACSRQAMRLMARKGVSDWGKERALRILSARMFVRSLRAGGLLLAAAAPLLGLMAIDANWAEIGVLQTDWTAKLALMPFTLGYAVLRWQVIPRVQRS